MASGPEPASRSRVRRSASHPARIARDRRRFDFTFFVSPYLAVGLFASLYLVFGILVAAIADRLDRPPPLPRRPFDVAGYAVLAVMCAAGLAADARVLAEVF